jgi:hypothetical protein
MSFMERADTFEELLAETRSRSDADHALAGLLADQADRAMGTPSSQQQWERQSGHDAFEVTNGQAGQA